MQFCKIFTIFVRQIKEHAQSSIALFGIFHCWKSFIHINIGDTHLVSQRNEFIVPIDPPDGNLGDYVPFYFGGHSPMLLNIKTGHRDITQRPQKDIVFICCLIHKIVEVCDEWCFTDGHAKEKISDFYNDLQHLDMIDWQIVDELWDCYDIN